MKNRVSKREIVEAIARKNKMRQADVRIVVEGFLDEIKSQYKNDRMIELRGFGTFYPFEKKTRSYTVPRIGEIRQMVGRKILKFKASRQTHIYGNNN